jgi:hypothetical protein
MPKTSIATSRQLRMIQPTLSAVANATRQAPKVMKKAIDLRRPLTGMVRLYQDRALTQELRGLSVVGKQRFTIHHLPFLICDFRKETELFRAQERGPFLNDK